MRFVKEITFLSRKRLFIFWVCLSALVFISIILVFIWFRKGLMFAGGEESIPFYDLTKNLKLISYLWYEVGTGFKLSTLSPKIVYFSILEHLFKLGLNSVFLQALMFLMLILIGTVAVFLLIRETVAKELKGVLKNLIPLLAGIFYLLNPYCATQIWGRGLYFQFFIFALLPVFLLFFVLGLKRRNFFYGFLAIAISLLLSPAYTFPGYA